MERRILEYKTVRENSERIARSRILKRGEILTEKGMEEEIEKIVAQEEEDCRLFNIRDKLVELGWRRELGSYEVYAMAQRLAKDFPDEMEQNLNEWLDNKPLTEIKYGDYSFFDMKRLNNGSTKAFYFYLKHMKDFINDGKKNPELLKMEKY